MDEARIAVKERSTAQRAPQAPPCTMVIFGAGGDLTKRLLIPAIYNLAKDKLLSDKFAIIAADRTPKPPEAYRDYLAEGVRSFVSDTASGGETEPFDVKTWDFIASRITHFARRLHHTRDLCPTRRSAQDRREPISRPAAMWFLSGCRLATVRHDRRTARRDPGCGGGKRTALAARHHRKAVWQRSRHRPRA